MELNTPSLRGKLLQFPLNLQAQNNRIYCHFCTGISGREKEEILKQKT
jgi:hypothetical protein